MKSSPGAAASRPTLAGLCSLFGIVLVLISGCGTQQAGEGRTIRLTIPAGTTELVKEGKTSTAVPETIEGRVGDTLMVENRDGSTQFIAGYSVSPGQTLKIPLHRAGSYVTNCSAHRDRSIRMEISD